MPAYTCDLCRMGFNRASSFTRHMRFHTAERPICNVCGLDFDRASNLTWHMRFFHTGGIPPFQCALCRRCFRHLSRLDRHLRNHHPRTTGVYERPYRCTLCGSYYRQRRDLYRHIIDERPFQCMLCESRYHQLRNMNRHMQLSHNHRDYIGYGSWGARATTRTQHTESLHGITSTVSTVTSSQGTAIVTTVQSATSLVATTTISQASGTFTHLDLARDPGNECPICFDSLNDGETITTPCCNAKYHIACLREVDRQSSIGFFCPNCRGVLTRDWLSKTPKR